MFLVEINTNLRWRWDKCIMHVFDPLIKLGQRQRNTVCFLTLEKFCQTLYTNYSVSSRISKGQGYQDFLRNRAGSSFGQKRVICVVQEKTWKMDRISLLLGSIKCFPISLNTFKTLLVAPWWSWYNIFFFMGQGAPWEVKGHKGAPWCQKGTAHF
jgi:hypothetical protein